MSDHSAGGSEFALINLMDRIDFRALSDADRLGYLDSFDELIEDLSERALELQASIAVAGWRAQVHDVMGGASA